MTPEENVALLKAIRDKVATAAPGCAMALGRTHERHMVDVTLVESGAHAPVTQTPAAPGAPPAVMTGTLRRSVTVVRGVSTGTFASTIVGPHTVYAKTQEFGGIHHGSPLMWLWVKYIGPAEVRRRNWLRTVVNIPARPYLRPSRDAVIADGSAVRAANAAFVAHVWG